MKLIMVICLGVLFMNGISTSATANSLTLDSTETKVEEFIVIKKVKVQFQKEKFWLTYESPDDLIMLSSKGFKIVRTSVRIIWKDPKDSFLGKLLSITVSEALEALQAKTKYKIFDLLFKN